MQRFRYCHSFRSRSRCSRCTRAASDTRQTRLISTSLVNVGILGVIASKFVRGISNEDAKAFASSSAARPRFTAGSVAASESSSHAPCACRCSTRCPSSCAGSGRRYTTAVVDPAQAPIVERIFREYLAGRGLKAIAHQLNHDGVPAPSAGRRGSGSWASSAVRTILLNVRYRGLYIHGRVKKVRQGGATIRVKADPTKMITMEIPEWRIVDDAIWFAVNETFTTRGPSARDGRPVGKYPLTGIAKCGNCGGAISAAHVMAYGGPNERVRCYGCAKHHDRGSSVCNVTVHQPMEEVESALIDYLQAHVLNDGVLQLVLGEIRNEIAAQLPKREADVVALEEEELATARSEQKRLARAVAMADDVSELVSELKKRSTLIAHLEAQIIAAKRTPDELANLVTTIESNACVRLADLRTALADRRDLREVFLALFPEGLTFTPARLPDEWCGASRARRVSVVWLEVTLQFALRPRRCNTQTGGSTPSSRLQPCVMSSQGHRDRSRHSSDPDAPSRHSNQLRAEISSIH